MLYIKVGRNSSAPPGINFSCCLSPFETIPNKKINDFFSCLKAAKGYPLTAYNPARVNKAVELVLRCFVFLNFFDLKRKVADNVIRDQKGGEIKVLRLHIEELLQFLDKFLTLFLLIARFHKPEKWWIARPLTYHTAGYRQSSPNSPDPRNSASRIC